MKQIPIIEGEQSHIMFTLAELGAFEYIHDVWKDYPNDEIVKLNFLGVPHLMAKRSETGRQILGFEVHGMAKDLFPAHWGILLGLKSITNLSGSEHMALRKVLRSAFTHNSINSLLPIVTKVSMDTMQKLCSASKQEMYTESRVL